MRVKAIIAYDGNFFRGFQKQKDTKNTVTNQIEEALISLNIDSQIRGSGRTDKGVHASNQIIDFTLPHYWRDLNKLKNRLNQKLKYIQFKHISKVNNNFHSRFSAKKRIYRYIFKTTPLSIFERGYISNYPEFDKKLLKKSLQTFQGEHDFGYFIKTGSITHSNIRTIYKAYYKKYKNYHIIYFEANGFLRSQVRLMIEFAMGVATKKFTLSQQLEQLNLEKKYNTKLAPPNGLYLSRIIY